MRFSSLVALLAVCSGSLALGQCTGPFSVTTSSGDSVTFTCTQIGMTSTWDFTIDTDSDGGNGVIDCEVQVTMNPRSIGVATLKNDLGSGVELRVTIVGSTPGNEPVDVGSVVTTGSDGPVRLVELVTSGNIGSITVDSAEEITVGNNLSGDITINDGDLETLTVGGFVSGETDISVPNGYIGFINLPTTGTSLGLVGNPATIFASEEIRNIYVDERIWADILVRETTTSGAYGPVGRIENFAGGIGNNGTKVGGITYSGESWDFSGFDDISTGNAGLYCKGNFRSNLTLHGNLEEPIEITGFLLGRINITGGASADISVVGSIGVDGDLPQDPPIFGSLTLGSQGSITPITSDIEFGESLLHGFVQINAPYAGAFTVDGDVDLTTSGAGDTGVEFYGGLSGTFQIFNSVEPFDSVLDGALIVGNDHASHPGAFTSTGRIDIQYGLTTQASIIIKDECQGQIAVHDEVAGSITATKQIQSGSAIEVGTLDSNGVIHAAAASSPLAGQININAFSSTPANTWIGAVRYGSGPTTITHTAGVYSTASSTWGGGAVGLVPFQRYDTECLPQNNGTSSGPSVTIAFFGPLTWDVAEFPFLVSYCDGLDCDPGSQDDSSNWSVTSGRGTRLVTLTRSSSFPSGWHFHLQPILTGDATLRCDCYSNVPAADFLYTVNQP